MIDRLIDFCNAVTVVLYCAASSDDVEADGPEVETVPDEADFLLAMSTVPGHVSFRSKSDGSWFITSLVRVLEQHAHESET